MSEERVARLETLLDGYNRDLPPLKEFILPGGTRPPAWRTSRAPCAAVPNVRWSRSRVPNRSVTRPGNI